MKRPGAGAGRSELAVAHLGRRMVKRTLRRRFWAEAALATASAFSAVLTIMWRDWIETVFRIDPDQHSGALEVLVVLTFVAATIACIALARREWRRTVAAPGLA
jgi:hypothetical protein